MIDLFKVLSDRRPNVAEHIRDTAHQVDGEFHISKSTERFDYALDFWRCYYTDTAYVPVSPKIDEATELFLIEQLTLNLWDDTLIVFPTSGTIGNQTDDRGQDGQFKLVCHGYDSIEWGVDRIIKLYEYDEKDVMYCCELPNSIATFLFTIPAMVAGVHGHVAKFNPDKVDSKFNIIPMTPKMLEMSDGKVDFNNMTTMVGGDPVEKEHVDIWKNQGGGLFWHNYGFTECIMPLLVGRNSEWLDPHDDVQVRINDDGFLEVKSPGLFQGYLGFDRFEDDWFTTNDLFTTEIDEKTHLSKGYKFIKSVKSGVHHI